MSKGLRRGRTTVLAAALVVAAVALMLPASSLEPGRQPARPGEGDVVPAVGRQRQPAVPGQIGPARAQVEEVDGSLEGGCQDRVHVGRAVQPAGELVQGA